MIITSVKMLIITFQVRGLSCLFTGDDSITFEETS
jgi:hypothetical protein